MVHVTQLFVLFKQTMHSSVRPVRSVMFRWGWWTVLMLAQEGSKFTRTVNGAPFVMKGWTMLKATWSAMRQAAVLSNLYSLVLSLGRVRDRYWRMTSTVLGTRARCSTAIGGTKPTCVTTRKMLESSVTVGYKIIHFTNTLKIKIPKGGFIAFWELNSLSEENSYNLKNLFQVFCFKGSLWSH